MGKRLIRGVVTWLVEALILTGAWGWGDFSGFVSVKPRMVLLLAWLALTLYGACLNTGTSKASGTNEIRRHRHIFWAILPVLVLWFCYLPYADRHQMGTSDIVLLRWLGCLVFVVSYWIRIEAIRAQGAQFSCAVSIQSGHRLAIGGPYRWARHPAYTGVIGVVLGLSLVFANPIVGTAMTVLVWFWMETRIWDEEKLLTAEFGGSYTNYAHKTRKLIPFIY